MTPDSDEPNGLERGPDYARLTMVGDVDAESVDQYLPAITDIVKDPPSTVVVNLGEVPFLDSSGIGLLASLARLTKERQVTVLIADASPLVTETLRTCGLAEFITFIRSGIQGSELTPQLREDTSEQP
jgi:anti-sigma B factor antagonist